MGADVFARAEFMLSAPDLARCPPESGAEVAFAGRSNAGKSSAINALTGNAKLARVSKTPGRTQLINFFSLGDPERRLVDLPGYGYAKVPLATKLEWQKHLAEYLQRRHSLRGLVLLMDIRHPLQDYDRALLDWARAGNLAIHAVLTKADKLGRGAGKTAQFQVQKALPAGVTCQLFSSHDGTGLEELKARLNGWLAPQTDASSAE